MYSIVPLPYGENGLLMNSSYISIVEGSTLFGIFTGATINFRTYYYHSTSSITHDVVYGKASDWRASDI